MPDAGGVCSSVYRKPAEVSTEDLSIMALNDRHYLARPYYGSRRMAAWLATQGHVVNRKLVEALSNYGRPEIFDTEQSLPSRKRRESGGSQFISDEFTATLKRHGITISMDGQRCYGASSERKASSSLQTTDGMPHAAVQ
jgi:hypothetical protein